MPVPVCLVTQCFQSLCRFLGPTCLCRWCTLLLAVVAYLRAFPNYGRGGLGHHVPLPLFGCIASCPLFGGLGCGIDPWASDSPCIVSLEPFSPRGYFLTLPSLLSLIVCPVVQVWPSCPRPCTLLVLSLHVLDLAALVPVYLIWRPCANRTIFHSDRSVRCPCHLRSVLSRPLLGLLRCLTPRFIVSSLGAHVDSVRLRGAGSEFSAFISPVLDGV